MTGEVQGSDPARRESESGSRWLRWRSGLGFLIGPAFFGLAVWFIWGPVLTEVPEAPRAAFPASRLTTAPRREILGDPPQILLNGFRRTCNDCHALFPVGLQPLRDRMQHRHVTLDHGINDACRNCHDVRDMNRLVLYSGESVSFSDVPLLCQKCHGPTYRDWERGIHGRVNDYWNPEFGAPKKLKCIQCHDPHKPRHPAMDPLIPLPGPHTLRMGEPPHEDADPEHEGVDPEHAVPESDPLRRVVQEYGRAEHTPFGKRRGGGEEKR